MPIYKTDGVDGVSHYPKKFVRLKCQIGTSTSTTFTKGEVMKIDTGASSYGDYVTQATGADLAVCIGVCAETKTVDNSADASNTLDSDILVQVAGLNEDTTADATLTAGTLVGNDGVKIEHIASFGATTQPFAIAVSTDDSSTYDSMNILIFDHGFYG